MAQAPEPGSPEALLLATARGDQGALRTLLAQYGPAMARYAGRYLARPEMGEDIVQDAFLKVWREAHRYDPAKGSAAAWLWTIATRATIDAARRLRVRRFLGLGGRVEDLADSFADDVPSTEAALAARQQLAQVRRDIDALPARQREALLLSALGGLDNREVAAIMGASAGSVEQLLVRARRSLRQALAQEGGRDERE